MDSPDYDALLDNAELTGKILDYITFPERGGKGLEDGLLKQLYETIESIRWGNSSKVAELGCFILEQEKLTTALVIASKGECFKWFPKFVRHGYEETAIEAIKHIAKNIELCGDLQKARDFVKKALEVNGDAFLSLSWACDDRELVGIAFSDPNAEAQWIADGVSPTLLDDPEFMRPYLSVHRYLFQYCGHRVHDDLECAVTAMESSPCMFGRASERLKNDPDFIEVALVKNVSILLFPEEFHTTEYLIRSLMLGGQAPYFMLGFPITKEVFAAAVIGAKPDNDILGFFHEGHGNSIDHHLDAELALVAVKKCPGGYKFVPPPLKTLSLSTLAVELDWTTLDDVPVEQRTVPVCLSALKQDLAATKYIRPGNIMREVNDYFLEKEKGKQSFEVLLQASLPREAAGATRPRLGLGLNRLNAHGKHFSGLFKRIIRSFADVNALDVNLGKALKGYINAEVVE